MDYRYDIVHNMMLDINLLSGLKTRGSVKWEARLQEFFKPVPIQRVSVPTIAIETNKDNINLERHLKWNLNYVPNELIIIIRNLKK